MRSLALLLGGITMLFGLAIILAGLAILLDFRGWGRRLAGARAVPTEESVRRASFTKLVASLWLLVGLFAVLFGGSSLL
ncbi:hypothetical protein OHA74_54215 [Streptomyces phaeochromogenes]|uniref:hypothetical protein n=1 Tax=Streptomyces phaeochromogenes TaxID=1923 RepID=UPI002E28591C|nr:hypothetical protein [Streptomyces phaeochromogenes]